jgi:hypothetical protein
VTASCPIASELNVNTEIRERIGANFFIHYRVDGLTCFSKGFFGEIPLE